MYDEKAKFSSYHSTVDIMAPGAGILSGLGTGTNHYGYKSGTSMATPLVASLCAALWSYESTLSAQDIINRVLNTADDISFENPEYHWQIGHGRINAYRAFNNITTQPYQAGFKSEKIRSLCSGDSISFLARSYSSVNYVWDFGDGNTDSTSLDNISHTYNTPGNFHVSLTIKDLSGNILAFNEFTEYVGVSDCQPITGERSQWFYGIKAAIDFRSGRATPSNQALLNFHSVSASESSFSYCLQDGSLLFYGGPGKILDGSHNLLSSGSIGANPSQGYLPLPFAGKFYLFNAWESGYGLHYYILDTAGTDVFTGPFPVTINNDTLQIAEKDPGVISTDESVIALPTCNNGYWLLVNGHEEDTNYRNHIMVIELKDSAGTPKFSLNDYARLISDSFETHNSTTKLKATVDGQFIAVANVFTKNSSLTGSLSILRFNHAKGLLDSLHLYDLAGASSGLCFSPDSRFLYVADEKSGQILQLNMSDDDPYSTKRAIFCETGVRDMQVGPDGKMYVSNWKDSIVGVIEYPNRKITDDSLNACGFRQYALKLASGSLSTDFPSFVDGEYPDLITKDFSYVGTETCLELQFLPIPTCDTSMLWYFGDGDSSEDIRPTHLYAQAGTYTVTLISGLDTIEKEVISGIISGIQGDTGVCDSSFIYPFSTNKDDYFEYSWSATKGTILTDPTLAEIEAKFSQSGTLKVVVTDTRFGCKDSSEVQPTYGLLTRANNITYTQPCYTELDGN